MPLLLMLLPAVMDSTPGEAMVPVLKTEPTALIESPEDEKSPPEGISTLKIGELTTGALPESKPETVRLPKFKLDSVALPDCKV